MNRYVTHCSVCEVRLVDSHCPHHPDAATFMRMVESQEGSVAQAQSTRAGRSDAESGAGAPDSQSEPMCGVTAAPLPSCDSITLYLVESSDAEISCIFCGAKQVDREFRLRKWSSTSWYGIHAKCLDKLEARNRVKP
jgi:hypothetical protein